MNACIGEQSDDLQGLRVLKPEEAHHNGNGMMKNMKKGEGAALEQEDESVKELVVLAEVKDVGPEEDRASREGTGGEAEEPFP